MGLYYVNEDLKPSRLSPIASSNNDRRISVYSFLKGKFAENTSRVYFVEFEELIRMAVVRASSRRSVPEKIASEN